MGQIRTLVIEFKSILPIKIVVEGHHAPKKRQPMIFETIVLGIMVYIAYTVFGLETAFTTGSFIFLILLVYKKQQKLETELEDKQRIINSYIKSQVGEKEYDKIINDAFKFSKKPSHLLAHSTA
jgi:hypothetical protein